MSEWGLLSSFAVLMVIALGIAMHPLRQHKRFVFTLMPVMIILIIGTYWQWGSYTEWHAHLQDEKKQHQVQRILKNIESPQALIVKLKSQLNDKPESAQGWYLLGRLYSAQNDWNEAHGAFKTAYELKPDDIKITINYAQSLWQLNQRQFNDTIRNLFHDVIQRKPEQPDALAMLAMDAFVDHDYQKAINYWQQLLRRMPPESEDAQAVRKAIAKAQGLRSQP